ncbi:hypothetical protein [Pseudomonas oryzihabitans]|nr:hypothetical protein [Pseudomonas psychrotolerans]
MLSLVQSLRRDGTPMDKFSLVHLLLIFTTIAFMALLASLIR